MITENTTIEDLSVILNANNIIITRIEFYDGCWIVNGIRNTTLPENRKHGNLSVQESLHDALTNVIKYCKENI